MRVLFAPRPAISTTTTTKTLRHLWFEASRSSHANLASTTRFTLSHDSASLAAISSCLFSLRSTLHLLPTSTPSAQFPRQSFCAARSLSALALVEAHWSRAVVFVRKAWAKSNILRRANYHTLLSDTTPSVWCLNLQIAKVKARCHPKYPTALRRPVPFRRSQNMSQALQQSASACRSQADISLQDRAR
jgi:hypothetical protein